MKIDRATAQYEDWLAQRIPLIPEDLAKKHKLMAEETFPFLRATFYRWSQTFPDVCAQEAQAPNVLGVGDLHIENFGTWRDGEGRLAWGVNDFDEACRVPYTCDLVRLATSTHIAIASDRLKFSADKACGSILQGYRQSLQAGGGAYVLAERHDTLRDMAQERLKDPGKFWNKLSSLKELTEALPDAVEDALRSALPDPQMKCRFSHRAVGLGSLGRRRYVAMGDWRGGWIAREAKELATSAWVWARQSSDLAIHYQELVDRPLRCPDPFVQQRGKWIVRRLAPDCSRVPLEALPEKHDAYHLLHAMGWETANVHLGSSTAQTLLKDLDQRGGEWLHHAASAMAESTERDWKDWGAYWTQTGDQEAAPRD